MERAPREPLPLEALRGITLRQSALAHLYDRLMVPEASLKETDAGLVTESPGWFVLNARDARWFDKPGQGFSVPFTGYDEYEAETFFPMLGMAIRVVGPGEPTGTYHWETEQEDFLVLAGEAVLIVEGQERRLKKWDFVHCPPETKHAFAGGGRRPVRAPVCKLAAVSEGRAVGLLLLRRDRRPLQGQLARGHTGRRARGRALPRTKRGALPQGAAAGLASHHGLGSTHPYGCSSGVRPPPD
jgi:mannose-6-phosphate isomerase-like protein (cupin superfamily)